MTKNNHQKKIYQKKKNTEKTEPKRKQKKTTKNRVFVGISSIANFKRFILTCNQKKNQKLHSSKVSMRSKIKTAALISNGIADQINRLINLLIH